MVETGAITPEQAQAAAAQIAFPPHAAGRRLVRRLGGRAGAGAAARRTPTRCCAPRWTRGCRRSVGSQAGGAAGRPGRRGRGRARARWWCWTPPPARCAPWPGGRDYRTSPYNRAVLARRQPGSAFKPFVWLAALEAGHAARRHRAGRADPHRQLEPRRISTAGIRGEITLEEALAQSLNTAAVRLLLQAGGADGGGGGGAPAGHRRPAAGQRRRWRSAPARWACWKWPAPTRRSSTAASG